MTGIMSGLALEPFATQGEQHQMYVGILSSDRRLGQVCVVVKRLTGFRKP